jgi:hypothetical protein
MNRFYTRSKNLIIAILACFLYMNASAQTVEWRLVQDSYNNNNPDGAGPAVGTVVFGLEMRAVGGVVNDITQISVGYSYQSVSAMVPTAPGCAINVNSPANVVVGPTFASVGFQYTQVAQCNVLSTTTGAQVFDRTAAGTLDNATLQYNLPLGPGWTRALTITLWSLTPTLGTEAGYAMVHSSVIGSPGPLTSYTVTQSLFTDIPANSLTYATPIPLGTEVATPVLFTSYDVTCVDKGAAITWVTATEINSSHFDIEKNTGNGWVTIGSVPAAGTSNTTKKYQYLDLEAGAALYRVKQVDDDGRFVYTAQRSKNCTGRLVNVVLYPVPTANVLNVAIRADRPIRTELQVYDMAGRIVKSQAASLNSGNNNFTINVAGLAVGEYILRSTDGTLQLNKKFTIAR